MPCSAVEGRQLAAVLLLKSGCIKEMSRSALLQLVATSATYQACGCSAGPAAAHMQADRVTLPLAVQIEAHGALEQYQEASDTLDQAVKHNPGFEQHPDCKSLRKQLKQVGL